VGGRLPYILTYGTRVATTAIGFAIGVAAARGLGASGRGEFALVVTWVTLVTQVANFGLSSAIVYSVSRRPGRARAALTFAWRAAGVLLAVGGLAASAAALSMDVGWAVWAVACWVPVQLLALLQEQVFLATRQYVPYNAMLFAGRLVSMSGALAVLVLRPGDVAAFAMAQIAAEVLSVCVGLVWLRRRTGMDVRRGAWTTRRLRPVFAVAWRAMPLLVLPFLVVRSDLLLIGLFRSRAETGNYAVAAQIVDVLMMLAGSFATVLFPQLAAHVEPGRVTLRVAHRTFQVLAVVALGLAVTGSWMMPFVFGADFAPSYVYLLILLPGAVAIGVETVLVQFFASEGFPRFLTAYWLVAVLVNVVADVLLVPVFGAPAAALSSTTAWMLVSGLVARRFFIRTSQPLRWLLAG
jgi:O-antigen/teichoic acid export membrane protein